MRRLFLLLTLVAAGCFNVDEPPCSYSCGPSGECPDDYKCGSDNYCHLHGTGICFYADASVPPDQSVAAPGDMSVMPDAPDLALPPDLATTPSPTPTPTPSPSPSPSPAIVSFGVIDLETTPSPSPVPIVITPTAPSPAPNPQAVLVTEQVVPSHSALNASLGYSYNNGVITNVAMTLVSSIGGADQYTGVIPAGASGDVVTFKVTIHDFTADVFKDPSGQAYTYVEP